MKQKILAQLKVKYSGVADEVLNGIADYLVATVTEEANIDAGVTSVSGLVDVMKREYDRRVSALVTDNQKLKADLLAAEKKKEEEKEDPKKGEKKEDQKEVPDWAKALIEANKTLAEKVESFESGQVSKRRQAVIIEKLNALKVPEKYYAKLVSGKTFKDDAEAEAFATEVETDWKAFEQEMADNGLSSTQKPTIGGKNAAGVSRAVQEMIDKKQPGGDDLGGKKLI
jgi:hypothetical protein